MTSNDDIMRKLNHIKERPNSTNINCLYIILKLRGFKSLPRFPVGNPIRTNISQETLDLFINQVLQLLSKPENATINPIKSFPKREIYMFQESSLLPKNVYVSERDNDENLEEMFIEGDITSSSESEKSGIASDVEAEEGYEFHEVNDEEDFSD